MNTKTKEISSLFSEETLDTISTAVLYGGEHVNGNCVGCGTPGPTTNVSIVILACKEQTNTSTKNNYY